MSRSVLRPASALRVFCHAESALRSTELQVPRPGQNKRDGHVACDPTFLLSLAFMKTLLACLLLVTAAPAAAAPIDAYLAARDRDIAAANREKAPLSEKAQARAITPPGGLIIATGSVYLVGEIRALTSMNGTPHPVV